MEAAVIQFGYMWIITPHGRERCDEFSQKARQQLEGAPNERERIIKGSEEYLSEVLFVMALQEGWMMTGAVAYGDSPTFYLTRPAQ